MLNKILDEMKPVLDFTTFFKIVDQPKKVATVLKDIDGNSGDDINKDGVQLFEHDFIMQQSHDAQTSTDFEIIFLREFEKDRTESKLYYRDLLIKRVREDYLTPLEPFYKSHGRELEIINSFINWLEKLTPETMPGTNEDILFNESIVDSVYKYNGRVFHKVSRETLFDALNFPEKNRDIITYPTDFKNKMHALVSELEQLSNKDWSKRFLTANKDLDERYFTKKGRVFFKGKVKLD